MEKRKLFKSGLILIIMTSLFFPSTVFAFDIQTDKIFVKINKIYDTTSQKMSGFKYQINMRINKITDSLPKNLNFNKSPQKSTGLKYKINIALNKILKKDMTSSQVSKLIVKQGGKKAEMMLNNLSSKQYSVDKDGFVTSVPGVSENLSKSSEYSIVIDNLINGNKPTKVYIKDKLPSGIGCEYTDGTGHSIIVGSKIDSDLAHESIHAFRKDQFLYNESNYIAEDVCTILYDDEEACTIQLENRIRYKNGLQLRNDGSSLDDINKDGIPDGDDSYGKYLNSTTGPKWFDDFLTSINKKK